MMRAMFLAIGLTLGVFPHAAAAEIVFESARLRAVLGDDAVWRSLADKTAGHEFLAAGQRLPCTVVRVADATCVASQARREGDRLTIQFAGCDTRLVYAVETAPDWITFRLAEIAGTRPTHVTLLQLPVALAARGGSRLNAAWDDRYAVCLRGLNLQSQGVFGRRKDHTRLSVITQDAPGPKLEGAGAALIASPTADLKPILQRLAVAHDLPRNDDGQVASRDLPIARQSYWFLNFGERDTDRVLDYCRRTGIRQVMMDSSSWCSSVGHFTFNLQRYPDGADSLRRTIDRLHAEGILAGMHTFASKVSKRDAYVTPVPSRGFWVDMTAQLAAAIPADATAIRTESDLSQWPGSPVCRQKVWEGHVSKHQEVIIDDEIIRYESVGPEGKWDAFLGCQRGAWGTQSAAHEAAAECRHYAVDGCINGYILDQESPLFQETTSRLAEVFNACGFDMVYFDGSEDVDRRRFDYYSANAHATAMRKFTKRPLIHQGGGFHHGVWHSFTRNNTVDQYPGTYLAYLHAGGTIDRWPTCKDHIDRSVRGMLACEAEMTPGELGWFGIGPKSGRYDGLQFDEIEYLMCKSLAYNAPISLQTSFSRLEAHPLTPDILAIIRTYEELRLASTVPQSVRDKLAQTGQDFVLLPDRLRGPQSEDRFVAVTPLEAVAGTHDVRSFVGAFCGGAVASLWHYSGKDGKLVVEAPSVSAYDLQGQPVEITRSDGRLLIPVDQRRILLHFPETPVETAQRVLRDARLELRQPAVIWLQAEDYQQQVGDMVKGRDAEVREPDALGDVVLCRGPIDRTGTTPCYAEYRVAVPHQGRWTLWARVRYPTGGDMSFGVVLPGEPVTLTGRQVLGNCGMNDAQWHWTGQGGGVTTVPPGAPITFDLPAGNFVFRIYPREGSHRASGNPRLDCLCLAEDPDYRPNDDAARRALTKSR
ncbi:MAG: hypothetical protein GX575_14850 [Candidatus Anammoximicrobium sp.]|nr:hypothetical protein [Candidatus Anammoximicrobium sp.]